MPIENIIDTFDRIKKKLKLKKTNVAGYFERGRAEMRILKLLIFFWHHLKVLQILSTITALDASSVFGTTPLLRPISSVSYTIYVQI